MSEESPEMNQASKALWLISFKQQHLHHRRAIILKAQQFSSAPTDESINVSELEAIQTDLQELSIQKDTVLKSGKLEKDPHDVQLFGESIVPEPDYEIPEELLPEPDYEIPEELLPESDYDMSDEPSPDTDHNTPQELSTEALDTDHNTPEEPSQEADQNTSVPMETVSQNELPENTVVLTVDKLARESDWVTCSSCSRVVRTVIKYKVTDSTWIFCAMLSSVGCVFGCCLVPFCLKSTKDISHHCPNCNAKIQTVSRL